MKEERIIELATKNYEKFQDLLDDLTSGKKITGQFKYFLPNDLVDLMNFYFNLTIKEWKKAYIKFESMDTDVRETIPPMIENFLVNKYEK